MSCDVTIYSLIEVYYDTIQLVFALYMIVGCLVGPSIIRGCIFFFNCDPVELCWHMLKVCMTSIMSFKSLTRSTNKGVNVSWEALTSL